MITSAQNARVKELRRILRGHCPSCFAVEGAILLEEAVRSGWFPRVVFSGALSAFDGLPDGIERCLVREDVLRSVSRTMTGKGCIAQFSVKDRPDALQKETMRGLLLEDIQDPGNVGTILRTADAFGYDTVLRTEKTASFWNDKVIRSSMGAIFRLRLEDVRTETLAVFRSRGGAVYGTSPRGGYPIRPTAKHILVLGNEAQGMSAAMCAQCDDVFSIPMPGRAESLNVAVAAGVLMYELTKEDESVRNAASAP